MRLLANLVLMAILAGVFGGAAHAQCVVPPLAGFGPIDPVIGFPKYYIDSTGTALQPCLNFVCDPALAVPSPNQAISFPGNFPPEVFYHRAISTLGGPGFTKATLVLALEGSFVGGVPAAGKQIVFARTRVTILGATPGGVYTVTHPYGVLPNLTADSLGAVRFTQDIGLVPGVFGAALNGGIGPFLHFLAGPVPPAPFNLGTSLAPQTVTGSPCGTNLFRVEGTGLAAGGVQTDKFGTLIGAIAPICGNGVLDPTEQCDDGNTVAGDCCSPTCTFEPAGQVCDDGNVCTVNSTCDGAGVCTVVGSVVDGTPCNDGNACTTADGCVAGVCVGGPPPNCNDGNICTTDTCDPATGCVHTPNTLTCSDGNVCTTADACAAGMCVGGPPQACPPIAVVEADATVASDSPAKNFGALPQVQVDGSPLQQGLYRVRVGNMGAQTATRAILRLTVADVERPATNSGGRIHRANCNWAEGTVTWNTRPFFSPVVINAKGAVSRGQVVDFDLTSVIGGDGVYCFTIESSAADGVFYQSREAGAGRPQLLITAPCCVPPPPPPPPPGPFCGDNIVNQPTEQCDGTDSVLCPGLCRPDCTCPPPVCTPTTCAAQGKNCGTIPDGCGGTLTCGACTAPQTCGGGGVANVCSAPAATALLTLTATGRAGEAALTTPAGLSVPVGTTGAASFPIGTRITLGVTNGRAAIWSGVCNSGGVKTNTCTFTLNAASSETASVQ